MFEFTYSCAKAGVHYAHLPLTGEEAEAYLVAFQADDLACAVVAFITEDGQPNGHTSRFTVSSYTPNSRILKLQYIDHVVKEEDQ
ncbi:hypothetical protein [Pseudomonas phage ZQG1]|nr:hypothetical protein [Pseudomonas phage ZQG1]